MITTDVQTIKFVWAFYLILFFLIMVQVETLSKMVSGLKAFEIYHLLSLFDYHGNR